MSSTFEYPELVTPVVVETGMMKSIIKRTCSLHHLGGLCVWSGRAGMGKTTTAEHMVELIEEAYTPDNPRAFRAIYYEASTFKPSSKDQAKHGIRSLYFGVGCKLDEGRYRTCLPEELAADLVHFLKKMNIQIIFIDEAGCLSPGAIRGIVHVSNKARQMGLTLTIVLIGMDNLPSMMRKNPNVERRVRDWCYFKPYTIEDTHKLLAALHPHFAGLQLSHPSHQEQISYIHEACKGMPGSIVPFVSRFANLIEELPDGELMVQIQAALIQPLFDMRRCVNDSQRNYKGELKEIDDELDSSEEISQEMPGDVADVPGSVINFPNAQHTGVEKDERHK